MTHRSQIRMLSIFLGLTFFSVILFSALLVNAESNSSDAMLETGQIVNSKLKALAVSTDPGHKGEALNIKAIRMAESLPDGFTPISANIVSTSESRYPIYIFFDNENNAGIMYFYTEAVLS